ncbi:hypothetical protein Hypma_007790 [Hypsizygus marmoreus]|uniref:N-acetyltransferase domain-containing protein n=1 Tax=Hypsizygus marmoreus TaxID=39966 RepID=A0A369JWQ7_HYPMA|nr:hypothetical protein Hypma_007790 [Hypsizygus marmoreus]
MSQHTTTLISPTGRLQLVPPTPNDDQAVSILRSHPTTLRHLRFLPKNVPIQNVSVRREARAKDPHIVDFHIHVMNADGSYFLGGMTGIFNVDEMHTSCEVGILISPDLHRGGFGTESLYMVLRYAFDDRKMHRATFETGEDNTPMRSWLENVLEATLEGKRRDCWKEGDGKYTNVTSYSILEGEWTGHIKEKLERIVLRSS